MSESVQTKPGAHNPARAFDLTFIKITGGGSNPIDMDLSWRSGQSKAQKRRYLAVAASLRRYFINVLTCHYNSAHEDHIHFDSGWPDVVSPPAIRDTVRSDTTLIQSSYNLLTSGNISVDGEWGPATTAALQELRSRFDMDGDPIRGNVSNTKVFLAHIVKCGLANKSAQVL